MLAIQSSWQFYLFIYLLCFLSLFSGIKSDELQILLKLKSFFSNSNTNIFNSWKSTNHQCSFSGITCNSDGFVTQIELSHQKLSGVVPFDEMCKLQSLEKLSLGFNSLHGPVIKESNTCIKLKYLDLGNNIFSGYVPDISSLKNLQYLHLNKSGFSGIFPWKSLESMLDLVQLSLGDNPFEESPFPIEVLNLTNLNWLYLSNCGLKGKIPEGIGRLTELTNLEISDSNMKGEIPLEIVKLKNLRQLELYNNSLTGKLPIGLRNLTNLENIDLSMNSFQGDLSELRFLTNLVSLQVFMNEFTGEIPSEFGEFKRLVNMSLYSNKLIGSIPLKIGSWSKFDYIDVSENFLTGPIPPDMCKGGAMTALLMLQNNLTGEIPANYANCSTLKRLRVSKNSLSGVVPSGIWGLENLDIIDIERNQLEGPLTSDIENAKALSQLFAANNRLIGKLPEEISKVSSFISIDLSNNLLSGPIPIKIGDLKRLGNLYLQGNTLSGPIPVSLGSCVSLSDLNMAMNSLSGNIPLSLGSLPNINSLNLSQNELSGQIPDGLASLRLSLLDLSHNKLIGRIPQSLSIAAYNGSFNGNYGLCSINMTIWFQRCSKYSKMSEHVLTFIICLAIGSTILLVSLAWFLYLKKRERDDQDRSLKEESWDVKSFHVLSFSEDEILDSIKQENLIGKGGSGNVYRVVLANEKEQLAVKHIWNVDSKERNNRIHSTTPMLSTCGGSKSKQFDAEVQTLSSIRHVNVVKLYCSITSEDSSLLVYEFLPNGSLWDRLHMSGKKKLDWETRYEIAVGAAKGLDYLHHGLERPMIHRDVKSSNILLDQFFKPRIADFGLARIVQATRGKDSTHVFAGTHGYIAPECGYTYKVNEKSDVYSFGVVLMELVTGKRPIEAEYGENKDMVSWICSKLKTRESILSLVDSNISEAFKEDAIKILRVSILCTTRLPELRPSMRVVVQMLEEVQPCKLVDIIVTKDGSVQKSESCDTKISKAQL